MKPLNFFGLALLCINIHLVSAQTFEQYIQSSADDAEEKFDGSYVTTSSSDLEMMYDSWNSQGLQTIGLRFDNIAIPANSLITNAYIQFTADGSSSGNITMTIQGEDISNSLTFSNSTNNVSGRTSTAANVIWSSIPTWSNNQAGTAQRTPDLSSIVTEIITSNGWQNGNPISFILDGTGNSNDLRKSYSFDEDPTKAAKLVIEYSSLSDVDLALSACITPTDFNYPSATFLVKVEVLSYGNLTANSYNVSYSIDGNLIATEPGTVPLTLGQSTVFTFAQTADLSAIGSYNFSAEVSIISDEDISNNILTKTISVIEEIDTTFYAQGSSWRYWDSPSNPGTTWNTIAFNDANWFVGAGHFGHGEGDETTELNSGIISYYFRKKIDVPDVNQLNEMYMHMVHDDAAIVYINGVEAFRTELMPLGAINNTTYARQSSNSSNENEFYTYKLDPSYFVTGVNTIAVSVRNRSAADGDLSFDSYLTPTFLYRQDGPYVYYSGTDIIVEEVTPTGLVSNTYTSAVGLQLTCALPHMNTSFSFELKPQITTEPSEYATTPSKFLTISDFDGHIEAFTMLLRGEGIIDTNFNWIYGDGHLIISGDLFDRGFHVTECMWLLYKLESEALAQGGKVHLIIGNHEMFNMTDDWRYVEVKYFNNAHLKDRRMPELYDSNSELGRWLRSKNVIERIGDYAFTHGGISPEVSALNLTYDEINDFGRMEMNGTCTSSNCIEVTGSDGVYWYRGMAEEDLTQTEVDNFLTNLGVERIIIGHTKDNTVRSLYNGRVLAIDMYHIDNFTNGYMEALQFELGCFYIFYTDDVSQTYTLLDNCDEFVNLYEPNTEGQIQIYPNPTSSILNIKQPGNLLENYNYTIVNQEGKVISTGVIDAELSSIDIKELAVGKYFLTLQDSSRTITGHFILKN
ncbi:MAG: metallophosphoesterase [Crocinitomicaceae bacterium]|nr:metallophosphoesterase [Flavobacteriales bacterium]NQZ35083.1 metallophosphoesterase [Crocinitomicaceae bacterium]